MVDDNPQDLVHDVIAEAVFGGHPLGRPVIGRAEVISSVTRRALVGAPPAPPTRPTTSSSRSPATSATSARASCSRRGCRPRARRGPTRRASRSSRPPAPGLPVPAQADRAVPRLPRRPGHLAPRRAPLRRVAARRDRRRLSVVPPLPGDPREARDGLLRLQLRARSTPTRGQIGLYVGTREENLVECMEIVARRALRRRGRQRAAGRARAREGEPEGADAAVARVDFEPDEPARQVAGHRHRAALARRAGRADRRRHRRRGGGARRRPARGSTASRRPGSGRARRASARRCSASTRRSSAAPRHEGRALRHAAGRSARCSGRRSRRRATSSSSRRGDAEAVVDFTRPSARRGERPAPRWQAASPVVIGTTGLDQERVDARGARRASCRSSTRRTSRSAPC